MCCILRNSIQCSEKFWEHHRAHFPSEFWLYTVSVWCAKVLCFLASPQSSVPAAVRHFFVNTEVGFCSSQFQAKSERNKRLAKISWRRGAAMKGNFVGPCANSSFVTVWCMKKTRKPEDQEWHVGCNLEVQEFVHLVFQKRFPELIKSSRFIGKGFSYNDKHACHNHDLIVWSVGQLSNAI